MSENKSINLCIQRAPQYDMQYSNPHMCKEARELGTGAYCTQCSLELYQSYGVAFHKEKGSD